MNTKVNSAVPTILASQVVDAQFAAKTPGKKAAATKLLNKYVGQQVAQGKSEAGFRAGIKASYTRRRSQWVGGLIREAEKPSP